MSQEAPTGVNPTRIKKRIKGREVAKELLALLQATTLRDRDAMEAMLETLRDNSILGRTPTTKSTTKTLPRSVQSVGGQTLKFGAYKGIPLNDVPLQYLDNLLILVEDSQHLLHEYLTHPDLNSYRPNERRVGRKK